MKNNIELPPTPITEGQLCAVAKHHGNFVFTLGPKCDKKPAELPNLGNMVREILAARFLLKSQVRPRCVCRVKYSNGKHDPSCEKFQSALGVWEKLSGCGPSIVGVK